MNIYIYKASTNICASVYIDILELPTCEMINRVKNSIRSKVSNGIDGRDCSWITAFITRSNVESKDTYVHSSRLPTTRKRKYLAA